MERDSIYYKSKYIKRSISLIKQEISEISLTDETPSLRMRIRESGKTTESKDIIENSQERVYSEGRLRMME